MPSPVPLPSTPLHHLYALFNFHTHIGRHLLKQVSQHPHLVKLLLGTGGVNAHVKEPPAPSYTDDASTTTRHASVDEHSHSEHHGSSPGSTIEVHGSDGISSEDEDDHHDIQPGNSATSVGVTTHHTPPTTVHMPFLSIAHTHTPTPIHSLPPSPLPHSNSDGSSTGSVSGTAVSSPLSNFGRTSYAHSVTPPVVTHDAHTQTDTPLPPLPSMYASGDEVNLIITADQQTQTNGQYGMVADEQVDMEAEMNAESVLVADPGEGGEWVDIDVNMDDQHHMAAVAVDGDYWSGVRGIIDTIDHTLNAQTTSTH